MTHGTITPTSPGTAACIAAITARPGIRTAQVADVNRWTLHHTQKVLRAVAKLGLIGAVREDGNCCAWFLPDQMAAAIAAAKIRQKARKKRENQRAKDARQARVRRADPWKYRDLPDYPKHPVRAISDPLPFELQPTAVRSVFDLGAA